MKATINGIVVEGIAEEITKIVREFGKPTVTTGGGTITTPTLPNNTYYQSGLAAQNAAAKFYETHPQAPGLIY